MSQKRSWSRRARRWVAGAVLVAQLPMAFGASELPTLGDATSETLSVADERALGNRIMREVLPDPDVLDDALLQAYLESVWTPLVESARRRGDLSDELDQHYAWRVFLVRDRTVNAFALPGGFVGVHLGLLSMTGSGDELAAVLAHELSHVTQRHIARSMVTQQRQSLLSIATLLLGVMAAARSPDAANALITGGQAVAVQGQLNFSRDMEREADRVGYGVLIGAGFAGAGMSMMFDHLQRASGLLDNNQYPYLRTHPLTTERIAEARSRLGLGGLDGRASEAGGGRPVSVSGPSGPGGQEAGFSGESTWLHAVMRGRARAIMDVRTETLRRLASLRAGAGAAQPSPQDLTDAVAAALASRRLRDFKTEDAALAIARGLSQGHPQARRAVAWLDAESALERGQSREAAQRWRSVGGDGGRASVFIECRIALAVSGEVPTGGGVGASTQGTSPAMGRRDGDLVHCAEDLQSRVSAWPDDAGAWGLLAQARERQGQRLAALRAQAEAQFVVGKTQAAIDRLRAGQQLARSTQAVDGIEATVIDARLKVMEQRRRQEMEDQRRGR